MSRRVLVTGAAGQDGTYLARLCAARGDHVVGLSRRAATNPAFAAVHAFDLQDHERLRALVRDLAPDECYHFAAYHRSSSAVDLRAEDEERAYFETNLLALQQLLAALRAHAPACRVLLAGSCHMFGDIETWPQNEETPFRPNTLYGITKTAALQLGRVYRQQRGLFVCTAILYNHESPLRGPDFVTTRLARGAVDVKRGRARTIQVGSLDAQVDWGFAGDYVRAMALMLQAPEPQDFVIASGALHSVRDFAQLAFAHVGLDWQAHVRQDAAVHRPVSRAIYHGDITRIGTMLGWRPTTTFPALVRMLVDAQLESA